MEFTSRPDFPETLPTSKTFYCWHCHEPGAQRQGKKRVTYSCDDCGRSSGRVLIYDPNMQQHFDDQDRLVHESAGVILTRADSKLLLFKRTKFPYLLTIPAGHLGRGEKPRYAAARETREEAGVKLSRLTKIFEDTIEGDSCQGGADIHHWNAYASTVDDTERITLDGEGGSWGWFDKKDLTKHNTVQPVLHLLTKEEVSMGLASLIRSAQAINPPAV